MALVIKVRNLHKRFKDPAHQGEWLEVIQGVDLDVEPGEVVVIIGRSGAGKSTLLRCLNFLEEPDEGTLEIDGVEIRAGEHSRERTRQIIKIRMKAGMVFQSFNLFPHMTALENVVEGLITVKKWPREKAITKAEEELSWVGLLDKRDEHPIRLSGGQQQRIAIARGLAMEPKIMLFDEPTSALDPELIGEVVEVMERLAREGMTMVVVSHEMHFVRDVANRIIFMDDGNWVEEGPPEELLTNPKKERTRRFLAHIL
ncbi:MAG: amino acid ABC transporter ATP-binding protein [Anaerolineae bacterium]|nr:amino acid ABC transporter ATP-binding protein [Anaerolineae bacterium]MCK4471463.1 amino acid ABC transporter ATP-binding protein [Anaerolineae bacterium]